MVTATKPKTKKRRLPTNPDPATQYALDVVAGEYVVGMLEMLACKRHLRDLTRTDLYFAPAKVAQIVKFYSFMRHTKGKWAGKPIILEPWQVFFIGSLVGWLRVSDGLRRFRHAHLEVAKKNGKSTMAAPFGLYMAFFDGEPGAEVYAAATKLKQSKVVWGLAAQMVKRTPMLKRRIMALALNLHDEETGSKFEPLGADRDVGVEDGIHTHCAIFDEVHAFKKRSLWDTVETSMSAREQPIKIALSTAGFDRKSLFRGQHDYGVSILNQIIDDDEFLVYIASIDEDDDWLDEAVWPKANPSLGVTVQLSQLRKDAKKARNIPGQENSFKRYRLNLWTEQGERWLSLELWDKGKEAFDPRLLLNRKCFSGLDLGRVSDFSAFLNLFPPEPCDCPIEKLATCPHDKRLIIQPHFWIPEESVSNRLRNGQSFLREWVDEGWINTTPGNTTDFKFIGHEIIKQHSMYDIREISYDRLFAGELINTLQEEGVELNPHGQGYYSMAGPCDEFERLLISELLQHGGNPVLRWMASNVVAIEDPAGNKKIDKSTSGDKVDGIVSLVMAISSWMTVFENEKPSIYETRGLTIIGGGS